MTRDEIQARIAQLEAQRVELIAQVNATMGAIQDCTYWLGQVAKAAEPEPASLDRLRRASVEATG
jgi:hypothetical protein